MCVRGASQDAIELKIDHARGFHGADGIMNQSKTNQCDSSGRIRHGGAPMHGRRKYTLTEFDVCLATSI